MGLLFTSWRKRAPQDRKCGLHEAAAKGDEANNPCGDSKRPTLKQVHATVGPPVHAGGFFFGLELVTKGAFSRKSPHASEWRLTFNTCDVTGKLASKAFMRWGREKQNAVSKYPVAVSNQSQRAARNHA
jgi:hypothetical protein